MMTATTWMDAQSALDSGFIDAITEDMKNGLSQNADAAHVVDRADAEKQVQAWLDRHKPHKPQLSRPVPDEGRLPGDDHTSAVEPANEQDKAPMDTGETAPPALPEEPQPAQDAPATPEQPESTGSRPSTGIPIAQLQKRLGLLMPTKRSN